MIKIKIHAFLKDECNTQITNPIAACSAYVLLFYLEKSNIANCDGIQCKFKLCCDQMFPDFWLLNTFISSTYVSKMVNKPLGHKWTKGKAAHSLLKGGHSLIPPVDPYQLPTTICHTHPRRPQPRQDRLFNVKISLHNKTSSVIRMPTGVTRSVVRIHLAAL